jgi:hypothetical protein
MPMSPGFPALTLRDARTGLLLRVVGYSPPGSALVHALPRRASTEPSWTSG